MKQLPLFSLACLLVVCRVAHADKVDAYIRQQMKKQHIPGLSLAVVRNGKIVKAMGYGLADVELNVSATPETLYEIGSITKQFTATAVMMQVEDGKIGIDDKISEYLSGLPDSWKDVTVRHLLTHTSGIKNFTAVPGFDKITLAPATHDEVIKTVAAYPLEFKSGDKWSYSNTGYYLLGMILEKASGKSYSDLLNDRIFKPLRMSATRINDLHAILRHRAGGYEWQEGALRRADFISMTWPYAAGALVSSVKDLAKWDAALYSDRLVKMTSLQQMWTPVKLNNGSTSPYGFGWSVDKVKGHTYVSHGGGIPGFTSYIARYPDDRLTVIVLCNQMVDTGKIAGFVAGLYLPVVAPPTYESIGDKEPGVTAQIKRIVEQAADGIVDSALFVPDLASTMTADLKRGESDSLHRFGVLQSILLVERRNEGDNRIYRYRLVYKETTLMTVCTFNKDNKIAGMTLKPE